MLAQCRRWELAIDTIWPRPIHFAPTAGDTGWSGRGLWRPARTLQAGHTWPGRWNGKDMQGVDHGLASALAPRCHYPTILAPAHLPCSWRLLPPCQRPHPIHPVKCDLPTEVMAGIHGDPSHPLRLAPQQWAWGGQAQTVGLGPAAVETPAASAGRSPGCWEVGSGCHATPTQACTWGCQDQPCPAWARQGQGPTVNWIKSLDGLNTAHRSYFTHPWSIHT